MHRVHRFHTPLAPIRGSTVSTQGRVWAEAVLTHRTGQSSPHSSLIAKHSFCSVGVRGSGRVHSMSSLGPGDGGSWNPWPWAPWPSGSLVLLLRATFRVYFLPMGCLLVLPDSPCSPAPVFLHFDRHRHNPTQHNKRPCHVSSMRCR